MNERVDMVHEIFSNGAPVAFFLALVICITWTVNTVIKSLKQRANVRTRSELYRQMIDRFGTAPEFIAFLQSGTGQKFIDENVNEAGSPTGKILGSIQIGIISTLLGIGLLVTGNVFGGSLGNDLYIMLTVSGTVSSTVGIGFLISAGIAYKLCKAWGLLIVKGKTLAE